MNTYLFSPGAIVATPAALEALEEAKENASVYLHRHLSGDWGEIDEFDKQQNEDALSDGSRVFSAYVLGNGTRIWIITEADRSSTCLLLPSDY
jgi:hypothetical protein